MNRNTITIQVPMKRDLYTKLKERAAQMGFDSIQAYIRFWATGESADQLHICASWNHGVSSPRMQALRYFELALSLCSTDMSMEGHLKDAILRVQRNKFKLNRPGSSLDKSFTVV